MKLLWIIGSGAVGKMTVGQELMKITDLRLFHNHMSIELVLEIFGDFNGRAINGIREVVLREFAASENYGLIFTYMWAFDMQSDWDYIENVNKLFLEHGAEIYFAELVAPQEVRLKRNATENRLANKASKRDIAVSDQRLKNEDASYRLVSYEGEIPYENYLRIDNSEISAKEAAEKIKAFFGFQSREEPV